MENEDRPLARLADHFRIGYEAYVRFMGAVYGGEPAAKQAELDALERAYRNSPDVVEKRP